MKLSKLAASALLAGAGVIGLSAHAQSVQSIGGVMADSQGKTLYVFTKDTAGKSNCNGGCLAAWPVFAAKTEAKPNGDFGIITRDDGSRQWTHKDRPLYYYVGDAKAGDKTGDKQGNVWFVVPMAADGKVSKAPAPAAYGGSNY